MRRPLFIALLVSGFGIFAQWTSPSELQEFALRRADSTWRPEVLGFVRNTEFFHPAEQGRTRFGVLVGTRRRFDAGAGRTVDLGVLVHQAFGAGPKFLPLVMLRHQTSWSEVNFGSITDRGHGLPRQLINPDLFYSVPVAYGLSGTAQSGGFRAHYWAEWLNAIDYGSPFKERIHAGGTAGWSQGKFALNGLVQYHHVGGQIDSDPGPGGNRLNFGAFGSAGIGSSVVKVAQLYYADPLQVFSAERQGRGTSAEFLLRLHAKVQAEFSYWNGSNFQAPLGQGLFQSRNPEDPGAWHQRSRQLLGFALAYEGSSSARLRFWYDVADRSVQPSVTWVRYLVLDPLEGSKRSRGRVPQ